MKQGINSEKNTDMDLPRATLIIPYCQEMKNPKFLFNILENAAQKKEKLLTAEYSKEIVFSLMKKIRDALKKIKAIPNDKTLTVFVSQFVEKSYFISPEKKLPRPAVLIRPIISA